jgi:hypothetical protein
MHNPFEKDSQAWQIFKTLSETLTEDDHYTPLELVELTHRCIDNPTMAPDEIKYQQLTLF